MARAQKKEPARAIPKPQAQPLDEELVNQRYQRLTALRAQIEAFAAAQAALRVAHGACTRGIETAFAAMLAAAEQDDYDAFLEADMAFHRSVAELADVPGLVEIWQIIEERVRPFVAYTHKEILRDLNTIAQTHRRYYAAVMAGDSRRAHDVASSQFDGTWQALSYGYNWRSGPLDPVDQVCGWILANLPSKLSWQQIARDIAHLSPAHLRRLFHQRTGQSFRAFVRDRRLERAAMLLSSTDLPIAHIAERVGYSSPSRLARDFIQRYGITPSRWRSTMRGTV
ncbi:MAG: helix-turn-helix domain-containing protein [Armatimonadetes bacterium]|nr:helix-turn-helix domain-containing protein [Armatimonadota bacterium]